MCPREQECKPPTVRSSRYRMHYRIGQPLFLAQNASSSSVSSRALPRGSASRISWASAVGSPKVAPRQVIRRSGASESSAGMGCSSKASPRVNCRSSSTSSRSGTAVSRSAPIRTMRNSAPNTPRMRSDRWPRAAPAGPGNALQARSRRAGAPRTAPARRGASCVVAKGAGRAR